ncbi:MAG: type IV pilus biogenesis protein PilP [Noviherbaspirillum sp.]
MRNNFKSLVLTSAIAATAMTVMPAAAGEESSAEKLTRIEAETLLLKAREKQLEVQAGIIAKQNEIMLKQGVNSQLTSSVSAGFPAVRAIEGIGKRFYATLQYGNGHVIDVKAGDALPDGMRVVSIRPGEVIVASGNKRQTRLTSTPAATPGFPAVAVESSIGVPPLPMVSMGGVAK